MPRELPTDYARKLAAAHAQAQEAGIARWTYDPPVMRLLRKMGLRLPPAINAHLGWLGFWYAVYFAVVWGVTMHFVLWTRAMPIQNQIAVSVFAGVLFGLFMAAHLRFYRRKHRLTPWSAL